MIKAKALCIFKQQNRVLLSENYDPAKVEHYFRPIGGSIEFGETSLQAIQREIKEELGAEIENIKLLQVFENLFTFNAQQGHEIVFLYQADFVDQSLYQRNIIEAYESDGQALHVQWYQAEEWHQYPVYPHGVQDFL